MHPEISNVAGGFVEAELGRPEEALPYWQKAVSFDPSNGEALFYLGRVHYDLRHDSDAEEALRKALDRRLSPKRLMAAHYQLGMPCRRMGKTDGPTGTCKSSSRSRPNRAAAKAKRQ
jgi:tetratricopeptide (TPR) repeat protein